MRRARRRRYHAQQGAQRRLLRLLARLLRESGRAGADFDAAAWLSAWQTRPCPALGGRCPGDLLDTPDGEQQVLDALARMQSSAYS